MAITITLPYDPEWKALEWAKEHCPEYITNAVHKNTGEQAATQIDYFFTTSRDAVFFSLKWL